MKALKKWVGALLALMMLASVFSVSALAAEDAESADSLRAEASGVFADNGSGTETVIELFPNLDASAYIEASESVVRRRSAVLQTYDDVKNAVKTGLLAVYESEGDQKDFELWFAAASETDITIGGKNFERNAFLEKAIYNTIYDNPDTLFFAQTGFEMGSYYQNDPNGAKLKVTITPMLFSKAEMPAATYNAALNKALDECYGAHEKDAIRQNGMTNLERVVAAHDWIAANCFYDPYVSNNDTAYHAYGQDPYGQAAKEGDDYWYRSDEAVFSPYGVFVNHKAVCMGYALACKALLDRAGVECVYADSETHAWNIVKFDDKWYHVDATWDDPSYETSPDIPGYLDRTFFLKTDSEISEADADNTHDGYTVENKDAVEVATTAKTLPSVLASSHTPALFYGDKLYVSSYVSSTKNLYASPVGTDFASPAATDLSAYLTSSDVAAAMDYRGGALYLRTEGGSNKNNIYRLDLTQSPLAVTGAAAYETATDGSHGVCTNIDGTDGKTHLYTTKVYAKADDWKVEKAAQDPLTLPDVTDKTYGDADFTVTAGGGSGTGAYSLTASPAGYVQISGPGGDGKNVFTLKLLKASGDVGVTLTLRKAADSDYNAAADVSLAQPFKIAKATPTKNDFTVMPPKNLTYDGDHKAASVAVKDGVSGMGGNIRWQYKKGDAAATDDAPTDAGSYRLLISCDEGENYLAANALDYGVAFDVAKADIRPGIALESWEYGETANEAALTAGSNPGNGAVTFDYKPKNAEDAAYSATRPTNAGDYVVRARIAETDNYNAGTATYKFSITRRIVTITGLGAEDKTYDGNTAATVTGTAALDRRVGNDDVTVTAGSAAFGSKNVGNRNVNFSGYALAGNAANNYKLSGQPASVAAQITPKPVTITGLGAKDKSYDGTARATVTGTAVVEGVIEGETVGVSAGSAQFENETVGKNKTVNFSGYELTGDAAVNYELSGQPASVTAEITKAKASVTTKPTKAQKLSYTGTAQALLASGGTADTGGMLYALGADDETAPSSGWASGIPTGTGAKTYYVWYRAASDGNHDAGDPAVLSVEIKKAYLTVTANNNRITYGEAPASNGVTYEGLVNGETEAVLTGTLDYDYTYTQYQKAGSYAIRPKGLSAYNYELQFASGALTVDKKEIGLTWDTTPLVYDGKAQAPAATATGLVNGDKCTVTVTGGKTGAGTGYTATASNLSNENYKLPAANTTTFSIARRNVTVTAEKQTVKLGGAISSEPDYAALTGAASGHTLSAVTLTLLDGISTSGAGNYPGAIIPSGAKIKAGNNVDVTANYNITAYVNGDLEVLQGKATVLSAPAAKNGLVYSSASQKLLDVTNAAADTALEYKLDGASSYSATVPGGIDAGTYKVWYRAKADGDHSVGDESSVTVTISPKPVTVTVTAVDRDYEPGNRSVRLLAGEVVGRCGSESVGIDLTGATAMVADDSAGENKPVTVTGVKLGDNAENYVLRSDRPSNDVTVTIRCVVYPGEKTAAVSVLPGRAETVELSGLIAQGGKLSTPAVKAADAYSIRSDTVRLEGTKLHFAAKDDAAANAHATIEIPVTGMASYQPYAITVTVTIAEKQDVTLKAENITKTYDGKPVEDSAIVATAKAGGKDVPGTWKFAPGQALTNVADSGVKTVVFTPEDPAAYKGGTTTLTLTVGKANVTVKALDRAIHIGDAVPGLDKPVRGTDYTVSGDVLRGAVTLKYQKNGADAVPDASKAGTYDIVPSGGALTDTGNYALRFENGTLTIAAIKLYNVSVATAKNGSISVSKTSAAEGEKITVTASPVSGYALDTISTTPTCTVTNNTFVMPAQDVTVSATFKIAPLSGTVSISGSPYAGEKLTASLVSSNNTGTLSYQWKANGVNISGATSNTLYLTTSEVGKSVTCTVTSTAPAGSVTSSPLTIWSETQRTDDIWLDETNLYLGLGESGFLIARTGNSRLYDDEVRWRSSNSKVVSVDAHGNYYAEGTGSATITATLVGRNGYSSGYSAYCNVTVSRYYDNYNRSNNNNTNIVIEQPTVPSSGNSAQQPTNGQLPTVEEIKQVTTTNRDGSKQTVVAKVDGSSSVVQTDGVGRVLSAAVTYSQKAVDGASWSNSALVLPATVRAAYNTSSATEVRIIMPQTAQGVNVKIPVENMTAGTVAVVENAFGPDAIVRNSVSQTDGLMIKLSGSAVVKIVDNSRQFYDVNDSDWFASAVAWVTSRGVMNGVSEHMFDPNGQMNRAMMTQILYNYAGADAGYVTDAFSDVSAKDWYGKSVTWAADNGIAHIFDDSFGALEPLTREDMASMLYNYARKAGYNVNAAGDLGAFDDNGSISSWARPAMQWAVGTGLLSGVGNGRLAPQGVATRCQTAAIMQRFCENVAK